MILTTTETGIYEYAKQGLALSPDKTAIWFYGKSITYRELFEKIDNVADHLYALGVREGTVVTIHLPNCPQAVMAIYAVAKLGGICNMVHALIPAKGLKEDMEFAESRFLITYQANCAEIAEECLLVDVSYHMGVVFRTGYRLKNSRSKTDCLKFETTETSCSRKAVIPPSESLSGKCIFYLHSSGTTDSPKTVMHCHRAINNKVSQIQVYLRNSPTVGETLLEIFPLFHSAGLVMDLHHYISGGGTLVMMAKWDVRLAVRFIKKYDVTMLIAVPRIYQDLLRESSFQNTKIHHAFVAGDYTDAELKRAFNARVNRDSCLYEGYGMTETVTACFCCGLEHDNLEASGYPLQFCRAALLLPDGTIKNVGKGELLISSNSLMMGYLNDKEATDAAFIEFDGEKWFRSGDMGAIDEEGYVYYIERIKNTIIHNGYNVYPAEVEKVIRSVHGVKDVCVVGVWNKDKNTQQICAYVIADKNSNMVTEEEIMTACRQTLPRYAFPHWIRFIDSFPRNRMAKVDRKALEQLK